MSWLARAVLHCALDQPIFREVFMSGNKANPALQRALDILEVISESHAGFTNADLARRLEMPKSSASSILRVLQNRGYLCRAMSNGRYKLGFKPLTLGRKLLEHSAIRDLALPLMRDLVERADLTCHLAIFGQYEAVHMEKIVAQKYFKVDHSRSVGERVPLHSSSVGKALLAWQDQPVLEASLPKLELPRTAPRTITNRARLLAKLSEIRSQGYAIDDEECRAGWRCVGAPIFDQLGSVRVAICLTGTVKELNDSRLAFATTAVKETARQISRRFAVEHLQFATYG
jgi:IclR family transcriptional regulator, KDG regulon repressor